jgi:hypothetical protein
MVSTTPTPPDDPAGRPFTVDPAQGGAGRSYAVPLVVAVTGHRDLVEIDLPGIRRQVREFLVALRNESPGRIVSVMSALAEGGDRVAAEEALALGLPLTVVLPMPRGYYEQDFDAPESRAAFAALCARATEIFELPLAPGTTPGALDLGGPGRARQYAQLGVFLCAHCHVLLALWDGKDSDQLGGTSQVVRFHHDDVMPGYASRTATSRLTLAEDESDLVYHVVCRRDRPDGEPAPGLRAGQAFWYTTDESQPRSATMPERHRRVFRHTNTFSEDAQARAARIDAERWSLLPADLAARLPRGLRDIDQAFCAADWLAMHYQKRVQFTLKAGHVCALLTGIAFISYTDLHSTPAIIAVIIGLMLVAVVLNLLAVRGGWHRKYLDCRTLAEGLRVQFYWAAAGVTSGTVSKFAHDNFLQMQDSELGWIRNVMRVAGTECDVRPNLDPYGLEFALAEWIGDDGSGQLGYYRRKARQRLAAHEVTQRIGRLGIWTTMLALLALLFIGETIPIEVKTPVVYLMGAALLMVGVRQAYAKATAEAELIKQYEFMYRIFRNARRRVDEAQSDADRRRVLKALGDAALEEHAEWILIHRERSIDEKEGLKIG